MSKLKINEAFIQAKKEGKSVMKKKLAAKLWEGRKTATQQVNMTNLCNGTTKSVTPDMVHVICDYLGCTAQFLFNTKE